MHESRSLNIQLPENISGLAWILSVSTLALSVFYDFSYLSALGLDFGEVQTSISDHIRSAILWLPWGAVIFGLFALLLRIFKQFNANQSTTFEFDDRLSQAEISKMLNRGNWIMIANWTIVAGAIIFIVRSNSASYFLFLSGWLTFSVSLGMRLPYKIYFSNPFRVAAFYGPLVVSVVGLFGSMNAELAINEIEPTWRVSYRQAETENLVLISAILLRRFSSTTIVVTTEKKLLLIPEDQFIVAERISSPIRHTIGKKIWLMANKITQLILGSMK